MEIATLLLTMTTEGNGLEWKIIGPLDEEVCAALELVMIIRSLRRWVFSSVENRPIPCQET